MRNGSFFRIAKTIAFIVGFTLFQAILVIYLAQSRGTEWSKIANIVLGLAFWLVLWRLSSSGYENRRGIGRWVGLSGLMKAFLILVVSTIIAGWGFIGYIETSRQPHFDMLRLQGALELFYIMNEKFPGAPGPIKGEILDELRGSLNAKINTEHTDFLESASGDPMRKWWPWASNLERDPWGHPYYFRFKNNTKNPGPADIVVISCGPNGKFEDGGGDDIVQNPLFGN